MKNPDVTSLINNLFNLVTRLVFFSAGNAKRRPTPRGHIQGQWPRV